MFVEHKEAMEVTEAPAKTLKLSEAIRRGAIGRPQCREAFFLNGASCALGAAYEGLGGLYGDMVTHAISDFIARRTATPGDVIEQVAHKNDVDALSFEQIADWLEAQGY